MSQMIEPQATKLTSSTLPGRVVELAERHPDRVALREKDLGIWQEISWAGYARNVAAAARALWNLGVRPGDSVSILSDNRTEWLYADLGAQAIGALSVGIYQTNPPADVAYIASHCGAKVLICEDQEQIDKAVEVREDTPTVEHVVAIDPRGTRTYDDPRLRRWTDLIDDALSSLDAEPGWFAGQLAERDPQAPSMVVYTSGTTGPPKGAMISSYNALEIADVNAPMLGVDPGDTMLSYLPLCHVAEKIFSLFIPLTSGCTVHFGESIETVREDLCEVSPTVFLGVPRIWEKMHASVSLKMKDSSWLKRTLFERFMAQGAKIADRRMQGKLRPIDRVTWKVGDLLVFRPLQERLGLRNCRAPITGAAPLSPDIIRWFYGIGIEILEGYGQTECAGVSHVNRPNEARIGTVGPLLPKLEHKLAADGEILVRGPSVFCGYLHNEAATKDTIDEDGWLHTGDIGAIDDDGFLRITGRKKEIIITAGGKNLSPEKIENAMKTSPYVKEAVAIGDARKFISALIQIDFEAVGDWASRRNITFTSFEDLAAKSDVLKLVQESVDGSNELLARVEQVRSFRLFHKELHQDDGELTATQKVRRRAITETYGELIESMYKPKGSHV